MVELLAPRVIHYEQWARLMRCYFDFYEFKVNENHLPKVFEKIQSGLIQSVLAIDGQTAVGVSNYIFNQSTFCDLECYLSDLYVDVEYRGHKIAKIIMDKVFQHAQDMGCRNVHWITAPDNEAAQRLYDKIAIRPNFIMYQRDL